MYSCVDPNKQPVGGHILTAHPPSPLAARKSPYLATTDRAGAVNLVILCRRLEDGVAAMLGLLSRAQQRALLSNGLAVQYISFDIVLSEVPSEMPFGGKSGGVIAG